MSEQLSHQSILVLGVGNTLRGDDALGILTAESIASLNLPKVEVLTVQQLQVELVDKMMDFEVVMIVDASIHVDEVKLSPLAQEGAAASSSHHTDVAVLEKLMLQLYGKSPRILLCQLPAVDFEMGAKLSPTAEAAMNDAVVLIASWLQHPS